MVSRNDITGDAIQTRGTSEAYANNYDLIFRKVTCPRCGKKVSTQEGMVHSCSPKEPQDESRSVPV